MLVAMLLLSVPAQAQQVTIHNITPQTDASFRGLSVVDDSVAWVSGSKGWVGRSNDGGRQWSYTQVKGYEKSEFRSLHAFDAQHAIIASTSTPAAILTTADGGHTWQKVYETIDTAIFFDGIDFCDSKHGVIYGDPVNGRMVLMSTTDGGQTWKDMPVGSRPLLSEGEASFAASGTCIKYTAPHELIIATGGTASRLLVTANGGKRWRYISTPILQGQSTTGIFSFLRLSKTHWLIAGGDYKRDTLSTANLFYTRNAGKTWQAPAVTTRGYRECLAAVGNNTLLAAGPTGIYISNDNGNTWQPLSDEKQSHVVKKARNGSLVVVAGGRGNIAVISISR
ncbi:MAG: YCF48-related protein [Bacteroidota bacterium]